MITVCLTPCSLRSKVREIVVTFLSLMTRSLAQLDQLQDGKSPMNVWQSL
jgi:hypothetical protein